MNTLNLKLVNTANINPTIFVDGKKVKFKKNNFGSIVAETQTDKNEVELSIYKFLELSSPLWWLWAIIYYIVGLFGIFDVFYPKNCYSIDCKVKVKLNSTNCKLDISFGSISGEKAIEYSPSNCEVEELKNEFYLDKTAKNRRKILLVTKIISWFIIPILGIVIYMLVS